MYKHFPSLGLLGTLALAGVSAFLFQASVFAFNTEPLQLIGGFDESANCDTLSGWACVIGADYMHNQPMILSVATPVSPNVCGPSGCFLANAPGDATIAAACGDYGNHRFSIPFPNAFKDGQGHTLGLRGANQFWGQYTGWRVFTCIPPNDPRGNFDGVGQGQFIGWTCDPNNYNAPNYVQLFDGPASAGKLIFSGYADQSRSDAAAQCGGNGSHGFTVNIPDSLKDGAPHSIYAYGLNLEGTSGQTKLLGGSPFQYSGTMPTPPPGELPKGTITGVTCELISGWTCDPDYNKYPSEVELRTTPAGSATGFIGRFTASDTNLGLGTQCGWTFNHGFHVPFPASLKDNQMHEIYAYGINLKNDGTPDVTNPLLFAPVPITCPGTTAAPDLAGVKTTPAKLTAGAEASYTITVSNQGSGDAHDVKIIDTIPANLTFVRASNAVNCTVADGKATCSIGPVNAGTSRETTLTFRVSATPTCGTSVMNRATLVSDEADANPGNDYAESGYSVIECPSPNPGPGGFDDFDSPIPEPTSTGNGNIDLQQPTQNQVINRSNATMNIVGTVTVPVNDPVVCQSLYFDGGQVINSTVWMDPNPSIPHC